MKTCSRCGVEYKATTEYFVADKRLKCGLRAICKECNRQYRLENKDSIKKYYEDNKDKILEQKKEYHKENFDNIMETKKARYERKREQLLSQQKEYYQENKEQIKKYREENAERIAEVWRIRRKAKAKHIAEVQRKYLYKRRRENVEFRILDTCRKRLYKAIANNRKTASTIELIGCTPAELKQHLEKQFRDGMSWDNYGEWHIDHIIPCASFDFTKPEQQRECFHYSNLQPMWAEENLLKSDKTLNRA